MTPRSLRRTLPLVLLVGAAAATGAGCNRNKSQEFTVGPVQIEQSGHKVRGKVTYKGQPVPYGYVLFFSQTGIDAKSGQWAAPLAAPIDSDGRYELVGPMVGPSVVCVACDPDADPSTFMQGGLPGGVPLPHLGGVPPGPPGAPHGPPGAPPGPPGAPPGPPGLPPPPGLPVGPDGKPINPLTEKLTAEQKKMLREIHEQYGAPGKSPIAFVVAGDADQTFNIELPFKSR